MDEHDDSDKQREKAEQIDLSQHLQTLAVKNNVQAIFLDLFRRICFNLLNGEKVVRDLLQHQDLWRAVYPARFSAPYHNHHDETGEHVHPIIDLAMMRNVSWGRWPADMIYIWTDQDLLPEMQKVAEQWQGEIGAFNPQMPMDEEDLYLAGLFKGDSRVLWVWWD